MKIEQQWKIMITSFIQRIILLILLQVQLQILTMLSFRYLFYAEYRYKKKVDLILTLY